MDWGQYGTFVGFAGLLVIAPEPDFAVTIKNSLAGGRRRGAWTALGIASSNALQGSAAALGLGALVLQSQPLFDAIRWAGVVYLAWLGIQALRGAVRGASDEIGARAKPGTVWTGWRQGFLSNITN